MVSSENIACLLLDYTQTLLSFSLALFCVFAVLIFGFDPVIYSMRESVGSVDLGVFFISGNIRQFVPHVNVSTVPGTAIG